MAKAISDTAEIRELERNIKEREIALQPSFHLRQQPRNMTIQGTQSMLSKQGFFDIYKNKNKRFTNHFTFQTIQGKKVVVDRSTGLMWHGSGSGHYMNYAAARDWIAGLNRNRYAGYSNWRIPTLEEAASLLETRRNNQGLFLNSIFLSKARSIWTCDTLGNEIWIVYFEHGYVDVNWPQFNSYVFPVRSLY
jgi:hypothetical protein